MISIGLASLRDGEQVAVTLPTPARHQTHKQIGSISHIQCTRTDSQPWLPPHNCPARAKQLSSMDPENRGFLYSTGRTLTSFHLFSSLPNNVRALILFQASHAPRTRFVELYGYASPSFNPRVRYAPRLPPLFAVSRETRNFSIAHGNGTLIHLFATQKPGNTFYINFEHDIIFLSSRFTPSGKSTETSRLRELSSLLKPVFLSQVRKIVVTYSGLDEYTEPSIGEVLLDYCGLETLYVAMCDNWSNSAVKKRLSRGRPIDGYVKFEIETAIKNVEGEETEVEDESDEEYNERTADKRKTRIVECELRLDE